MKHRPIALALALTLLCGCASPLVPNEYTVVSEHSDTTVETESDALTAESYEELKYAILAFVETGTTQGIIRVYHYDGDVTEDITSAAYEVWKNDPMGAYAVEFITTECNLLLSYYEIRVEITYRDDVVDASQIQYVRGTSGAERAIQGGAGGHEKPADAPHLGLRRGAPLRGNRRTALCGKPGGADRAAEGDRVGLSRFRQYPDRPAGF